MLWIVCLATGLVAGAVSGFFGVGGGSIIVPALTAFAAFPIHRAIGTSLAVLLFPVGLGAVVEYHRHGNVDWRAAGLVAVSLFAAAWIAGRWANRLNPHLLRLAFGVTLVLIGGRLVFSSVGKLR